VETLSAEFKPEQYRDTFQETLKELIAAKQKGQTIVVEEAPKRAPVIDMMEALKHSLEKTAPVREKKAVRARAAGSEREHRRRLAS
jgi:DNA end-binding protein Ku